MKCGPFHLSLEDRVRPVSTLGLTLGIFRFLVSSEVESELVSPSTKEEEVEEEDKEGFSFSKSSKSSTSSPQLISRSK